MRLSRSIAAGLLCIAATGALITMQANTAAPIAQSGQTTETAHLAQSTAQYTEYAKPVKLADGRLRLKGTAPDWTSADNTATSSTRVASGTISATILLKPNAGHAQRQALEQWLENSQLQITQRHDSISALSVSGTRAVFGKAFNTTFISTEIDGRKAIAPRTDLSIPGNLSAVETVTGLVETDAATPTTLSSPAESATSAVSDDCATYWGEKLTKDWPANVMVKYRSNALCGYSPQQLRSIHQLPAAATGSGTTIGIVAAYDDPTVEANTNTYFAKAGAQVFRSGQYVHHTPSSPDESRCGGSAAWTTEQHLDVQAAHAIAPDANIEYWGANDCSTNSLYMRILDAVEATNTPDVISLSFGAQEELDTAGDRSLLNRILVEAASRDISVFASTGNDGDYSNSGDHQDGADVASPASSPYVTAVGGTSTGLDANGNIEVEAGWETQTRFAHNGAIIPPGFIYGAGGGQSKYYARPSWQQGLSTSGSGRLLPDVSSLADPNTGFTVYSPSDGTPTYESHGGTSLATPMVAATVDLAKAQSGTKIGLAAPFLYKLAGTAALRDVKPASAATWYRRSAVTGQLWLETLYMWDTKPQSLQSSTGWDPVTGVGVPNGSEFLKNFGEQQ
jgi:subtilase family serine protease